MYFAPWCYLVIWSGVEHVYAPLLLLVLQLAVLAVLAA